jgi:hypothetical protein
MGKKFWAKIILCVFIGTMASVVLANIPSALTPKGLLVSDPEPSPEAAPLMDKVQLADYALSEDPGQMVKGDFVVNNASDKDIKNVEVLCEFFDASGKYLDREQWLLSGKVPAGKAMRHSSVARRFVNTTSKSMKCRIVDFQIDTPPMFVLHRVEGGHGGHGGGHGAAAAHGEGHGAGHGEAAPAHH